jgi:hypothetical protein
MEAVNPASVTLDYRDAMVDVARRVLGDGRVGVGIDGFAGRMLAPVQAVDGPGARFAASAAGRSGWRSSSTSPSDGPGVPAKR